MKAKQLSSSLKTNTMFLNESFAEELLESLTLKGLNFFECGFTKITWDKNSILQGCNFNNCRFNKNEWSQSKIEGCQFVNCTFIENIWEGAVFNNCTFVNCEFKKVTLTNCSFANCLIDSAKFVNECSWSGTLTSTKLLRSSWPDTALKWSTVAESHFYQMDVKDKLFPWTKAEGTVFDACNMGNCNFSKLAFGALNFSRCQFDLLDLTEANPVNVDFIESQIKKVMAQGLNAEYLQMGRTIIAEGNFDNMTLAMASIFTEAKLTNISFAGAKMGMAVFQKANIIDCTFDSAEFLGCNLEDAKLKQVSFKDAKVKNLHLSDTIMDGVEGLS